jgi:lipopolysaccharide/colanic/teichoic acid biosynthesis glycosyltransferase
MWLSTTNYLPSNENGLIMDMVIQRPRVKLYKPYYRTIKRSFELVLCLIMAPLLIPCGLIIAIVILLESSGPALFVQERIGQGGQPFDIIKFRTMHHDIDKTAHRAYMKQFVNGNLISEDKDQVFKPFTENQVTRMGRILRKTSLDELPQLINVVRGEMSLVGPRPNVPWEVQEYLGWHIERLEIPPGITGLAQVRGRSSITFDDIVRHDIEYIKNQSLLLDLWIIWRTITSILTSKGAE